MGGARPALVASPLFPLKPTKAHMHSRIPVTPPVLRKIPESLGTFPMSEYGRDIKIDILEAYIWISEVFRVKSGFYRSTGGLSIWAYRFRVEYVGANMSIQVPLLVIDRRHVSVMSTLFSNP